MHCPGPSKDGEMSLEGETWGMEVEPAAQSVVPMTCQTCKLEGPPHT